MNLVSITPDYDSRSARWLALSSNSAIHLMAVDQYSVVTTTTNRLWQKEALINHAIRQLSAYDAFAWIDRDILMPAGWFQKAKDALEEFPVVQLFSHMEDLDENGHVAAYLKSANCTDGGIRNRMPGGAIAVRREVLPDELLYDRHGRADALFMDACHGIHGRELRKLNPTWAAYVEPWCEKVHEAVQGRVGCLDLTVQHRYHGTRLHKKGQVEMLNEHDYDPANDVRVGSNGLLEWASDKPQLHAAVREYFGD